MSNQEEANSNKKYSFRPYARLLTMLGDQLIKDERTALTELIKNAYDADASWVKVSFVGFDIKDDVFKVTPNAKIIIEDDGAGMTKTILENSWMNPATPNKYTSGKKRITAKKRIIQGEKGIGRFAILKLGKHITIYTRSKENGKEYSLDLNFSEYDNEFLMHNGQAKELFLDQLKFHINFETPPTIKAETDIKIGHQLYKRNNHGTRIVIKDLKNDWTKSKIDKVYDEVSKLESIFSRLVNEDCGGNKENIPEQSLKNKKKDTSNDFAIGIAIDEEELRLDESKLALLSTTLQNSAVFHFEGNYNSQTNTFEYDKCHQDKKTSYSLKLDDPQIIKKHTFESFLVKENDKIIDVRKPECGSFGFSFYVFDFSAKENSKYHLDKEQKELLKAHRIYLYRDQIRVYPFGDPNDDWLKIDVMRGTISAGAYFSNDQVVGHVDITHDGNSRLKDKTNREGLIEDGYATSDFVALVQTILSYFRAHDYSQYQKSIESKKIQEIYKKEKIDKDFDELKQALEDKNDNKSVAMLNQIATTYKLEREYLEKRVNTTEELAGVGLSVETASHDVMSMMSKLSSSVDYVLKDLINETYEHDELINEIQKCKGMVSFIESQLKDIQLLFRSAKRKRKNLRIEEMLDKVVHIYKRNLKQEKIQLEIKKVGSPLVAKMTEAVILQTFINLFDNAIYWITIPNNKERKILITLDGDDGKMIFSDNGPGIHQDDIPYVFEPFYSGRGEEGKGLGLYITRQLLERLGYGIELADSQYDRKLSGANFVVNFLSE